MKNQCIIVKCIKFGIKMINLQKDTNKTALKAIFSSHFCNCFVIVKNYFKVIRNIIKYCNFNV